MFWQFFVWREMRYEQDITKISSIQVAECALTGSLYGAATEPTHIQDRSPPILKPKPRKKDPRYVADLYFPLSIYHSIIPPVASPFHSNLI
jgi:hypothetical protein